MFSNGSQSTRGSSITACGIDCVTMRSIALAITRWRERPVAGSFAEYSALIWSRRFQCVMSRTFLSKSRAPPGASTWCIHRLYPAM